MTRVTLLLCLTIFALTYGMYKVSFIVQRPVAEVPPIFPSFYSHLSLLSFNILAAPDPSKRTDQQQDQDIDQQDQEPGLEQPQQPVANYMAGPEGPQMDQQMMAPPMDQQMGPPMDQQAGPQMDQPTDQQMDCCQPGPTCFNPCAPPAAPISFVPPPPPPPPPPPAPCCQPGPTCTNPCAMPPPMPDMGMGMAGCCDPSVMPTCQNPCPPPNPPRAAYAPYPGEYHLHFSYNLVFEPLITSHLKLLNAKDHTTHKYTVLVPWP